MLPSSFFRKIFSLCIVAQTSIFAWNVSSQHLYKEITKPASSWVQERIQSDFSIFADGFSSADIDACLDNLKVMQGIEKAGLVRIHFEAGNFNYEPLFPLNHTQIASLNSFLAALNLLNATKKLPELDFILCLSSNFDRPILLKETNVPIFAVSKERHNHKVILIPRLWKREREISFAQLHIDWNSKTEKAFWRGVGSDEPYTFYDWDRKPRAHLALFCKHHQDIIDAALLKSPHIDAYFTNWIDSLHLFSSYVPPQEQTTYKYLLSLDGISSPSSFEWQLFTKSLIFKTQSNRIEWFYDALVPGVHFIPFHPEINDLAEKIHWAKSHDTQAQTIAAAGYDFAKHHLLDEDAFVYLYLVLNTYSYYMEK